jgi:hypothetical protein
VSPQDSVRDVQPMSGIEPQDAAAESAVQQGRFTIIVLLASSEGLKQASKRMAQIHGMRRIGRGVFEYSQSYRKLRANHDLPRHVALRKTRTIPRVRETAGAASQERTYALVTYRFSNPTAQQKKTVQRLRRRAAAARLRPGVLLFPHIRAGESRKHFGAESKRPPLGSRDFTMMLSDMGAVIHRWTKLRLIPPGSQNLVAESIAATITSDADTLETRIRCLRHEAKNPEGSTRRLKERYKELSRQFKDLRTVSSVIRYVWTYDAGDRLRRVYNLLLGTRRAIADRSS